MGESDVSSLNRKVRDHWNREEEEVARISAQFLDRFETSLDGKCLRLTLSQSDHDRETHGSHDGVTEEQSERSSRGESSSSSEEETGSDDSTDRN